MRRCWRLARCSCGGVSRESFLDGPPAISDEAARQRRLLRSAVALGSSGCANPLGRLQAIPSRAEQALARRQTGSRAAERRTPSPSGRVRRGGWCRSTARPTRRACAAGNGRCRCAASRGWGSRRTRRTGWRGRGGRRAECRSGRTPASSRGRGRAFRRSGPRSPACCRRRGCRDAALRGFGHRSPDFISAEVPLVAASAVRTSALTIRPRLSGVGQRVEVDSVSCASRRGTGLRASVPSPSSPGPLTSATAITRSAVRCLSAPKLLPRDHRANGHGRALLHPMSSTHSPGDSNVMLAVSFGS
jgi:hypothetical protein